jgi:hypothetical protein
MIVAIRFLDRQRPSTQDEGGRMKLLRIATGMAMLGLLVACASVPVPAHSVPLWRQQAILQWERESQFNMDMHRVGMGIGVGLASDRKVKRTVQFQQ